MTNAEIEKSLKKHLKNWTYFVEHWGWKYTIHVCDGLEEMPEGAYENTAAITTARWQYLDGSIYFNLRQMRDWTEEEIEEVVVHELTHFLVAPVQTDKRNLEISVSMIARTLKGLRDAKK